MVGGRNADLAATLSLQDWCDAQALRLNPDRARGVELSLNLIVDGQPVWITVARQVEFARIGAQDPNAAATVRLSQSALEALCAGEAASEVMIDGDTSALELWLSLHDPLDMWFNIATP
jgi:alkyl sulfatase BDS1-like metallo-beta-lactamase superfamily hydrolase